MVNIGGVASGRKSLMAAGIKKLPALSNIALSLGVTVISSVPSGILSNANPRRTIKSPAALAFTTSFSSRISAGIVSLPRVSVAVPPVMLKVKSSTIRAPEPYGSLAVSLLV